MIIHRPAPRYRHPGARSDPGTQRRVRARLYRKRQCLIQLCFAALAAPLGPGFRRDDDSGEERSPCAPSRASSRSSSTKQ